LMFCLIFVFSCILQVLEENSSNSKIRTKLTFGNIQHQINFEFKKREVGKICYFLERI
jgi:hypothetical protein